MFPAAAYIDPNSSDWKLNPALQLYFLENTIQQHTHYTSMPSIIVPLEGKHYCIDITKTNKITSENWVLHARSAKEVTDWPESKGKPKAFCDILDIAEERGKTRFSEELYDVSIALAALGEFPAHCRPPNQKHQLFVRLEF